MSHSKQYGLTLIELLLAITLFSVTGTVLYSVLHQGIQVWERTKTEDVTDREERIYIKKISDDIRGGFIYSWIRILGKADEIYFCSLKALPRKEHTSSLNSLMKTHYYFVEKDTDEFKRGIYVREYTIDQSFLDKPLPAKKLTDTFRYLKLSYGYWDSENEQIIYKDEWEDPERFPRLIKMTWKISNHPECVKVLIHPLGVLSDLKKQVSGVLDAAEIE